MTSVFFGMGAGLALGAALACVVWWPTGAPAVVFVWLGSALWVLIKAVRAARGTALRGAVVWSLVAVVLGMAGQIVAFREPWALGRPWAGHWVYLASLAVLAALISVFNARRPGAGAGPS